jgi:hypothetical protein
VKKRKKDIERDLVEILERAEARTPAQQEEWEAIEASSAEVIAKDQQENRPPLPESQPFDERTLEPNHVTDAAVEIAGGQRLERLNALRYGGGSNIHFPDADNRAATSRDCARDGQLPPVLLGAYDPNEPIAIYEVDGENTIR